VLFEGGVRKTGNEIIEKKKGGLEWDNRIWG